jgi:hypothetical protein
MGKLRLKQKKFVEAYLEHGNATQAVIDAKYNVKDRNVAKSIASENLAKPDIIGYMQSKAPDAANSIYNLAIAAENEGVRLGASKDILDRSGYSAPETPKNNNLFIINLSEEQKADLKRLFSPNV